MRRALLICSAAALNGCAGMLSWDSGERGTRDIGLQGQRPPPEQPLARAPERKPEPPRNFPVAEPAAPLGSGQYRVQSGDTLYSIAFRNNLDFRELARWNGIGNDYRIVVGQVLNLSAPRAGSTPPPPAAKPAGVEVPAPMPALPAGFEWTWPTRGTVTRGFAPAQGSKGIYIAGEIGQPVFAAAPGRVVYSGNALKGYGELIIIKHDEIHLTAYGYNRRRHVVEGDIVTSGQPIGELGLGPESKPLLHFELRAKGKPVDPAKYLPKPG
jgi:lipoprotein NlpD